MRSDPEKDPEVNDQGGVGGPRPDEQINQVNLPVLRADPGKGQEERWSAGGGPQSWPPRCLLTCKTFLWAVLRKQPILTTVPLGPEGGRGSWKHRTKRVEGGGDVPSADSLYKCLCKFLEGRLQCFTSFIYFYSQNNSRSRPIIIFLLHIRKLREDM